MMATNRLPLAFIAFAGMISVYSQMRRLAMQNVGLNSCMRRAYDVEEHYNITVVLARPQALPSRVGSVAGLSTPRCFS
jgi:hypothetical protein